jgi:micrococcal nuclease
MLSFVRPLVVLALAVPLAACGPIDGATTRGSVAASPGERVDAIVTRVVDGDTIHVSLDGQDVTIRLIGIDTPETVAPGQPIECYGPEASHFTTAQLAGQRVQLEFDEDLVDPFDRTLAYVWLGGQLFNQTLVRRGFAEARAYPPDTRYRSELEDSQAVAASASRGLWGACR